MNAWIPRGENRSSREVLVEGVPPHMRGAILDFLKPHFSRRGISTGKWFFDESALTFYDLEARRMPAYRSRLDGRAWPGFVAELSEEELLDMADWVVHRNNSGVASDLGYILEAAGSVWTIGKRDGNSGLVRRMPASVQAAADETIRASSAGSLYGEAWAAAFGRLPDPEEAYEKAIKSVEEAAATIVSPSNTRATLGTMLRDMKAQKDWGIDLPGAERGVVVAMVEALWTGQESRHGGNNYRRPTQSEAETAVTLALALLQLFRSGSASRRLPSVDEA